MTASTTAAGTPEELRAELLRSRLAGRARGGRTQAAARRPGARTIPTADRDAPLVLSAGQRQLWFLHQLDPDSPEYLLPLAYRLTGPLDEAALRRACDALTARHEVLRTRYVLDGDTPRQVIDAPGAADFAVLDQAGLDAAERDLAAVEFAEARAAEPFDLAAEAPLRIRLLRLAEDDHVLVLVMHHIACDAATRPLLLADLAALHRAAAHDSAAPNGPDARDVLPELPVQYADYAAWLTARQDSEAGARDLAWWKEQLAGVEPLALPTDRTRPAVRDGAGAVTTFAVDPGTAEKLRSLCRDGEATLFMALLTAYQVLLGRYAGRSDVTVGAAVSQRTRPELRGMAGYAYTSLALRARWSGDPSFRALLADGRRTVLDSFDHQDTPFDRITDEIEPDRDLSTTPIFQVMLDLAAGGEEAGPLLPGLTAEPVPATARIARFDLTLHLTERGDGSLHGSLEYATALFDAATAERIAGHYRRLLAAVAAAPDAPLSTLDLLDDAERSLLLDGPATPVGTPRALDPATLRPVHELIAAQAAADPEAPALVHDGRTVSRGELDAEAEQFARRLIELGAGPETTVAVLLDREPALIAALLGIWRAGAAYVPIDPGYPDDRIAFMLGDTGTELVLTEHRHAHRFAALEDLAPRVLVVDDPGTRAVIQAARAPLPDRYDLDQLAYVIYTSGSTGRPKGVLISHRGLANYLGWTAQAYATAGEGGAPLFSSVAFDLGVPDLYTPLMTGQPVHLLPQDLDTADLGTLLVHGGPYSFIKLTPGHLDLLQQQLTDEEIRGLAGLVIAAGDSFTARLAERWAESAGPGGTRLAAEYGPTEITVGNSAYFLDGPVGTELVSIGRAIPHTTMYVLDDRLRPLPVGVPGEVWIGGVGLARGYAGRPDLTAERFVPDPYGPPGARLYRTGDLARVLPDGNLDFLARVDHQVKLRGYRIELGEIESALTAVPDIAEAVALVREDSPGDKQLVAYLVPAEGADPEAFAPARLRERLGEALPPYMVPSAYLRLDALPLTGNGKLDRRALPAPGREATAVGEHVAARDETERTIAEVWAEVLGLDEVGVRDNFFDLGGDSIRAVSLVGALREAGWETTVRDVFEHRTVAKLAQALGGATRGGRGKGRDTPHPPAKPFEMIGAEDRAALPADIADAYPVSLIQAGMLVEMYGGSGENRYHNITSFRIRDELPFDQAAFQRAADLIVERHEVMRTSFALTGYSRPLQLVHASGTMPFLFEDLRELPEEEREQALLDFADRDRAELFDLRRPPLMRMAVHLRDDTSWWLSITECHPVIEGWSYHSQLMELVRAYHRIRAGQEPEPAPPVPAVRYADFIAAELRSLADDGPGGDVAYWRRLVDSHEKFTVPAGWAGDPNAPDERWRIDIPMDDVEPGLRALASAAEVPYKSVLHAAHHKVLSLLTRAERFRGGMVADARPEQAGAERVSGMYLNSVPFPYRCDRSGQGAATWGELAREVFASEVELWPHRRHPMPAMRATGGESHLIDVLFHYLDFHQVDTDLIDIMASRDDSPNEFPLVVGTPVRGHFSLASRTRTVSRADAGRLAALYRAVFADMAAAGADGDCTGSYPSVYERRRLAAAALPHPEQPREVLAAFDRQVARTPWATALTTSRGNAFSYESLDTRANRIARRLHDLGAGPESRVAVLLERGPDLVATLLAVWKTGAAQVPIDPCTPAARIETLVTTAGCDLAVTQNGYTRQLTRAGLAVLTTEEVNYDATAEPLALDPAALGPDRLAYVLHTSGSTGEPKAVEISHRALAHYLDWAVREYTTRGDGGAPHLTSIGFDLGVPALYAPLMTGQRVHLLPQRYEPDQLGALLLAGAPYSWLALTPGHLTLLAAQLTDAELSTLAALLVCAGDAYPAGLAEEITARTAAGERPTALAAEYGPTEATVAAAFHRVDGPVRRPLVPLGGALPGVRLRLLDARLRPVPDGIVGEVFLGGDGLARGYTDRPDLTAEAFLPDPYGPPGARLYRTGDLARRLADGRLEFAGRADGQVKIRGHRVELGEAEAALTADPAVREAVVVAVPATDGGRRLAAWVVPADTAGGLPGTPGSPATPGALDVAALRDRLRTVLPTALVPATVTVLDALPLSGNGKVDRSALLAPARPTDTPYTAPRDLLEQRLAEVWAEVLGLPRVGVRDDFRDLGGDSLLVPPLLLAARQAGLDLDLATALRHHTVAATAAALRGRADRDTRTPGQPVSGPAHDQAEAQEG